MLTLKAAREAAGLSQAALAQRTNINAPIICFAENGDKSLSLAQMIKLEQALGQPIDWRDPISLDHKVTIFRNLMTLSERFPLQAVLDAARKVIAEDVVTGDPTAMLSFYADNAVGAGILPPGDFEFRRNR